MRLVILILAVMVTTGVSATPRDCGDSPVLSMTKEDGTTVGIVISAEQRKKAPTWDAETGEPPLSISKAIVAGKAWAKKTYTRYDDVRIDSVSLNSYGCSSQRHFWYYIIDFSPIIDGNVLFGSGNFVAVLMDGTVIGPVPVKE